MSEQMRFADFLATTTSAGSPPPGSSQALKALWYDRRGDWNAAHDLAQGAGGREGAWVHAYLHRKEGDEDNAAYWYRLANQPIAVNALDDEWQQIAETLLSKEQPSN